MCACTRANSKFRILKKGRWNLGSSVVAFCSAKLAVLVRIPKETECFVNKVRVPIVDSLNIIFSTLVGYD